ncbi:MAG: DUF721 domain-containing protein [Rikenellaceae bacterium]
MEKTEPKPISEAFSELFRERDLQRGSIEGQAKELWGEVVGDYVATATEDVYVRGGVIYVHFKSPVVRADVMMRRNFIVRELNRRLGVATAIRTIVLR